MAAPEVWPSKWTAPLGGARRAGVTRRLLAWFDACGRQFPWREDRTPYKVFVSEFLLKRTTSTAASRLFPRFICHYPDIRALAGADVRRLQRDLRPIGLHRQRASAIRGAARHVLEEHDGEFPADLEQLLAIPGVGDYTASCILSFGLGVPRAIVDSNVDRVISRAFADEFEVQGTRSKAVRRVADWLLPRARHQEFNYSLLDLGASLCSYRGCAGGGCPISQYCAHFRPLERQHQSDTTPGQGRATSRGGAR